MIIGYVIFSPIDTVNDLANTLLWISSNFSKSPKTIHGLPIVEAKYITADPTVNESNTALLTTATTQTAIHIGFIRELNRGIYSKLYRVLGSHMVSTNFIDSSKEKFPADYQINLSLPVDETPLNEVTIEQLFHTGRSYNGRLPPNTPPEVSLKNNLFNSITSIYGVW